jgi:hypothetical protein
MNAPLDAEDIGLAELFQSQRDFHEAQLKAETDRADRTYRSLRWQAFAIGVMAATMVVTIAALIVFYKQQSSDRARARDRQLQQQTDLRRELAIGGRKVAEHACGDQNRERRAIRVVLRELGGDSPRIRQAITEFPHVDCRATARRIPVR